MSPNPHQPRPKRTRRMRDPRTRFQTVVRPEQAAGSTAESSSGPGSQSSLPSTPHHAEAPEGTTLYPYIISDLKLSSLLMAGVIALTIILWIILK